MPWQRRSLLETKRCFIQKDKAGWKSFAALCKHFGISRKTGYKWRHRYRSRGWRGLKDRPRRPGKPARRRHAKWHRRLKKLHLQYPHWGRRKLWHKLVERYRRRQTPHPSTLGDWLRKWGLSCIRARRSRRGPVLGRTVLGQARCPNAIWTVDFKGWFRTGDGTRCEPLTVRDLFSRFILCIVLLRHQSHVLTQRVFVRLFRRYGLPQRIRVDNGSPFGSSGAAGFSRLSAWWLRLGIQVEYIRPGHPEENGGHERMHRDYKAETLFPAAATWGGQQKRTNRFVKRYNWERPHQALNGRKPAQLYRRSQRRYRGVRQISYPKAWAVRRVRSNGTIKWQGRQRFIGEAVIGQLVGLKSIQVNVHEVYFVTMLLGTMYAGDRQGLRPARQARQRAVP